MVLTTEEMEQYLLTVLEEIIADHDSQLQQFIPLLKTELQQRATSAPKTSSGLSDKAESVSQQFLKNTVKQLIADKKGIADSKREKNQLYWLPVLPTFREALKSLK